MASAAPVTYMLEPNHSFVHFSYDHMGFSTQQGRFDTVSGTVTYDAANGTGSVDISIDTRSIDCDSRALTRRIQGPELFDVAHYPTATFRSTVVRFDGDRPVSVRGLLTVKGITHAVTLRLTHFKQGLDMRRRAAIGADAITHIKRSDFGMGKFVPLVGDEVTVSLAIEAGS